MFWASAIRFLVTEDTRIELTLPEAFTRVVIMNTIIIGAIVVLLRLEGGSRAGMGLNRNRISKQVLVGVLLGPAMLILNQAVVAPIVTLFFPGAAPIQIGEWFQDLSYIPLWLVMAVYGGGLGEELTRVFVLTRFEKLWGRPGLVIAILAHAAAFGLSHMYQGAQTAIGLGITNLVYSLIFVRRRSALEMILAHLTFDVIGITLGFVFFYRG